MYSVSTLLEILRRRGARRFPPAVLSFMFQPFLRFYYTLFERFLGCVEMFQPFLRFYRI